MNRRALINGTALGGALLASVPADAAAAGAVADVSDRQMEEVVKAMRALRDEISHQASFWEVTPVREQFKAFARVNGKFPDFIDVGIEIWQQVYDWHVRFQQPMTLGRTAEGRLTVMLMMTSVVMRTDQTPNYVSLPYDR